MADDANDPVWVAHGTGDIQAPELGADESETRWWIALVAVAVGGVIAASWFSTGPTEDTVSPLTTTTSAPSTTTAAPTTEAPTTTTTTTEARLPVEDVLEIGFRIGFPVTYEGGWLALRLDSSELMWSVDGLEWIDFGSDRPLGVPLGLAAVDDGLTVSVIGPEPVGDRVTLQSWHSADASSWELLRETTTSDYVLAERRAAVSRDWIAVVVDRGYHPESRLPGLEEVLSELIDPAVAARVCQVELSPRLELAFSLADCDGEEVAGLSGPDLSSQGEFACVNFLLTATSEAQLLGVSDWAGEAQVFVLDAAERVVDMTGIPGGIAYAVVDLRNIAPDAGPCIRLGSGPGSGINVWTPESGTRPVFSINMPGIDEVRLATLEDGRLLAATASGLYAAAEPFNEWEFLLEPPTMGGEMNSSSDGSVLLYSVGERSWVAPPDGPWVEFAVDGFATPLLGTDDYAIIEVLGNGVGLARVDY